mgnify:CR=1 FL=1
MKRSISFHSILTLLVVTFAYATTAYAVPVSGWNMLTKDSVSPLPENTAVRLESPGKFRMDADLSVLKKTKRAGWNFKVDIKPFLITVFLSLLIDFVQGAQCIC